jgi:hypothetical protein
MWIGIGITIAVILLITILIAVCEIWCILDDIRTSQKDISEKVNVIISNIKEINVEKYSKVR